MIVGTAGHIDHGKTSLVHALTGVQTDRLEEEKARGITIELGFAYWPRPSGLTIGFVDVPGHERLVHTMLAGATGIDLVVLVVAADDGVMPQTREHLAIIDLLGIGRGLVALTKCDLADADRRGEVARQIRGALAGSAMAEAPIIPVSAHTREGLAALTALLDEAAPHAMSRNLAGRFRLAVDRRFSLAGAGTVVTGTALSGAVAVGDRLVVSPSGLECRVRSIHAQNQTTDRGAAGQRCALALVGPRIGTDTVARGDVVLEPSLHAPVRRFDATLKVLASEKRPLGQSMPVKLHHGAAEIAARVVALSDAGIAPGTEDFVQLVLEAPTAVSVGDRFVLRDVSATRTIGGGRVLDLDAPERHRRAPARLAELRALSSHDVHEGLEALLAGPRGFVDIDGYFRDRAASADAAAAAIARLDLVCLEHAGGRAAMSRAAFACYVAALVQMLDRFHEEKPDLPGLGQERLRLALRPRLPAPVYGEILHRLASDGLIVVERSWARRPAHVVRLSEEEERIWAGIQRQLGGTERFRPPRVRDIARRQSIDEGFLRRLFKLAARRGDVDEIAQDHFFLSGTVVEMADIARELAAGAEDGQFAVTDFRDRLDNGRKVAIQILEFFDRQGLTMRRGDIRRINPHKKDLYSRLPAGEGPSASSVGGVPSPVGRPDFKSGEGRETALGGFDSCLLRQDDPQRR